MLGREKKPRLEPGPETTIAKSRKHRSTSAAQNKPRRRRNEPSPNVARKGSVQVVGLLDLLPSLDAQQERKRLEKLGCNDWLISVKERRGVILSLPGGNDVDRANALDIYRRCHEQAATGKARAKILSDLAAHFPTVFFHSPWPFNLLASQESERTLRAVSAGLKRAADRFPFRTHGTADSLLDSRELKPTGVLAARGFAETVRRELGTLDSSLKDDADQRKKRARKALEILRNSGATIKPKEKEDFLTKVISGKFYKAAVTLAATVFKVPERDIRSNPLH